jgi:hypothetical protein
MLFNDRPSFSEELHCHGHDDDIVLYLGALPNNLRHIIPIGCNSQWNNYVRLATKSQLKSLDVVVHPLLNALTHQPHNVSLVGNIGIGNEHVRSLVYAQLALRHDGGAVPLEEIPLT